MDFESKFTFSRNKQTDQTMPLIRIVTLQSFLNLYNLHYFVTPLPRHHRTGEVDFEVGPVRIACGEFILDEAEDVHRARLCPAWHCWDWSHHPPLSSSPPKSKPPLASLSSSDDNDDNLLAKLSSCPMPKRQLRCWFIFARVASPLIASCNTTLMTVRECRSWDSPGNKPHYCKYLHCYWMLRFSIFVWTTIDFVSACVS